jgi:hypothetical protein
MADFPLLPEPIKAQFKPLGPKATPADTLVVHFNPESLQYTITNTLRDEGKGAQKKQFVDKTDPKLSMQLVFDTTDSGRDVRLDTIRLAKLISPYDDAEKNAGKGGKGGKGGKQVPPNVEFSWGNFAFTGLLESYKETLDYFSETGVPLRSMVDITMTGQQPALDDPNNPPAQADIDADGRGEAAILPGGGGPAGLASALGAPRAARDVARANGAESLRGSGGSSPAALAVPGNAALRKESAFATAGPSRGGIGIGAGVGGGGFEGLRARVETPAGGPDGGALIGIGAGASFGVAAGAGARFGIGGAGSAGGDAGQCAEVGSAADLARLIRFQ